MNSQLHKSRRNAKGTVRRAVVALLALGTFAPAAMADPFDRLAARVEQYEEQIASGAVMQEPTKQAEAEVVPAPIPEPAEPDAGELGIYPGDGMWHEPMAGGDCCEPGCRRCGVFWGRAEYLLWWVRGADTPPLVTTSPDGTPVGIAGVLPAAQILFGNERINTDASSGGRFTLGYWCDPCETLGIEDTFLFVGNDNDGFFAASAGSPILARPFFNTQTDAQDALLIAYPNISIGSISVTSDRTIVGNEVNLRRGLYADCCRRFDILAGYRFFHLAEALHVRTNATAGVQSSEPGTNFVTADLFDTRSQFNGGQVGVNWQLTRGCWTFDLLLKLALGGVSQRVVINGSTVITPPGGDPSFNEGGLLALASNSGNHNRTRFGVMPELGLNARYQWSPLWTVSFGYTFIGLTNVVRPGDQIDLRIDPDQLPPPIASGTFPAFAFKDSDLWLQGINFAIECAF